MPGASPLADPLGSGSAARRRRRVGDRHAVVFRRADAHERFPASRPDKFTFAPDRYLEQLRRVKARVSVPVIASINGTTTDGWLKYARPAPAAGSRCARAELLSCRHGSSRRRRGRRAAPARHRCSPEGNPHDSARREALAILFVAAQSRRTARGDRRNGLVVFNRFYQADIEPEGLKPARCCSCRHPEELLLRLRWLAILRGRIAARSR